jgi:rSAM/selenodomain-associated transferase 1
MCKAPRSGVAKTRLAPLLGTERAAQLSACFMRDIADTIASLPAACDAQGYAVFAPRDGEDELRAIMPLGFGFLYQGANDLGMVLAGAARALFALGHRCVILVNSDSPTLPPVLFEEAIHQLEAAGERVVFGPATDGGYYLIGMKAVHQSLFEDVPWSTADVLSRSLERASKIGLPSVLLAPWYDVDDAESLQHLRDEFSGRPPPFLTVGLRGGAALATRELLASFDRDSEHEGVDSQTMYAEKNVGAGLPLLTIVAVAIIAITIAAPFALRLSDSAFIVLMLCHSLLAFAAMRHAPKSPSRMAMALIFAAALVMRLALVWQPPLLSDDLYRYLWDGRIEDAGFNPFAHAPADDALRSLRDSAIYPHIDKKDYAVSIYPPVAQAIFAATAVLSDSVVAIKLAMVAFEAAAVAAILCLLDRMNKSRALVVGYLWHPAALWEIANNAHVDAAMMCLVFVAFAAGVSKGRSYLAGALLALAALVKPTGALALPAIWRPFDVKLPAFVLGVVLLCYTPFLSVGKGVFGFLGDYVREQEIDTAGSFYLLKPLRGDAPAPAWMAAAYFALAAAVLIALMLRASFRRDRVLETSLRDTAAIMIAFLFFLSPDFPWYFLVLLPFVPLIGSWSAFAMTSAGFLLYGFTYDPYSLPFFTRASLFNGLVIAAIAADLMLAAWRKTARSAA